MLNPGFWFARTHPNHEERWESTTDSGNRNGCVRFAEILTETGILSETRQYKLTHPASLGIPFLSRNLW